MLIGGGFKQVIGGGFRPTSVVAGFLAAENQRFLAEEEGVHVCQGIIWSAYGMTLVLLVIETLGLRRGQRAILARLQRLLRLRNAGDKQ